MKKIVLSVIMAYSFLMIHATEPTLVLTVEQVGALLCASIKNACSGQALLAACVRAGIPLTRQQSVAMGFGTIDYSCIRLQNEGFEPFAKGAFIATSFFLGGIGGYKMSKFATSFLPPIIVPKFIINGTVGFAGAIGVGIVAANLCYGK